MYTGIQLPKTYIIIYVNHSGKREFNKNFIYIFRFIQYITGRGLYYYVCVYTHHIVITHYVTVTKQARFMEYRIRHNNITRHIIIRRTPRRDMNDSRSLRVAESKNIVKKKNNNNI